MDVKRGLRQLSPYRILIDGLQREAAIKTERELPAHVLPTEAGFDGFMEIQKIRLATTAKITGAIMLPTAGVLMVTEIVETVVNNFHG